MTMCRYLTAERRLAELDKTKARLLKRRAAASAPLDSARDKSLSTRTSTTLSTSAERSRSTRLDGQLAKLESEREPHRAAIEAWKATYGAA